MFSLHAFAVPGKLKQQILPLDCIYEVVNDGTGTIIYHTPEACGQLPEPGPDPDPEPQPEPVDPTEPPSRQPGTVTIIDAGGGRPIVQVPVVPTPGTRRPVPDIAVTQVAPNSNEITVSWQVPSGYRFREFAIEVRRIGTLPWTQVATVADNRRSTVITLTEGEYDVRVLGISTNPTDEPMVLGVTRIIVQYTPVPAKESPDYSWVPWVLLIFVIVAAFWWNTASRRKKQS